VPSVVTPGASNTTPPSDAIVLFDGKNLDEWVSAKDKSPAKWIVADDILTVSKAPGIGNIETKQTFKDYQLHMSGGFSRTSPAPAQTRGNSGVFLALQVPATPDMSCRSSIHTTTRHTSTGRRAAFTSRGFHS